MLGGSYEDVCGIITNTINTTGGMVCDGAKSSCASKIATAVGMALLAMDMSEKAESLSPARVLSRITSKRPSKASAAWAARA